MPLVTARVKRQLKRQPGDRRAEETADIEDDEFEVEAITPSRRSEYLWTGGWRAVTLLAFAVGLGSSYLSTVLTS